MARTGLYREQIQLVFPSESVSDGVGGWLPAGEGVKVATWARIQQLRGSQLLALGQQIDSEVYKITTRYRMAAFNADRILWNGKSLKITSCTGDEKRTEVTIYCIDGR